MEADGSNVTRLTQHAAEDMAPLWSADGSTIFFQSTRNGGRPTSYRMRADGSNVERVEDRERLLFWAWSPDRRLVVTPARDAEPGRTSLYIMNADGSERRRLTFGDERMDSQGSFSPDGSTIVYESFIENPTKGEIYTVEVDGSNRKRLAAGTDPSWSPDGSFVLFKALNDAGQWVIHVIGSDGSGERSLTEGFIPRWFPDGRRIVFFAPREGTDQIFVLDLADGTRTQLTR